MSKYCPMKATNPKLMDVQMQCDEHDCAWWVTPYTIEGILMDGMCAIEMLAMKAPAQYQV